jgi:hypothetical protein
MSLDPELHRRLVFQWAPGTWVGATKRVFGPIAEVISGDNGLAWVETHPPHSLLVLWKPPRLNPPLLKRFPWMVSIAAAHDDDEALAAVIRQLPPGARMFIARHDVDWALMAEIVVISEPNLAPYHYRELQAFVLAEREATRAAVSAGYLHDDADGTRHFARTQSDDEGV